jgi:hypothetical protein
MMKDAVRLKKRGSSNANVIQVQHYLYEEISFANQLGGRYFVDYCTAARSQ